MDVDEFFAFLSFERFDERLSRLARLLHHAHLSGDPGLLQFDWHVGLLLYQVVNGSSDDLQVSSILIRKAFPMGVDKELSRLHLHHEVGQHLLHNVFSNGALALVR